MYNILYGTCITVVLVNVDLLKSRDVPEKGDGQHDKENHDHLDEPGVHNECDRHNISCCDWRRTRSRRREEAEKEEE